VVTTQFERFYGYIIFKFADAFAFCKHVSNFGKGKPRLIATQPTAAGTVPQWLCSDYTKHGSVTVVTQSIGPRLAILVNYQPGNIDGTTQDTLHLILTSYYLWAIRD
jgi:hypothetical protein